MAKRSRRGKVSKSMLVALIGFGTADAMPPIRSAGTSVLEVQPLSVHEASELREEARSMFTETYAQYMAHAFPRDELAPISCTGKDTFGGYSLTLIDALDSLAVVSNNASLFADAVSWVASNLTFDVNATVSVFETNIRVLGSLLSAHLLASDSRTGFAVPGYQNSLLELARDLGKRLLPAFHTPTGIPFGSINLKHGVSPNETRITSTACGGTLALEFGTLSRLTGDYSFERAAVRSLHALWSRRSRLDLVGAHIDVVTGEWTHVDAGIGTSVDSFYEYLLKAFVLLGDTEYLHMFKRAYAAAEKHLKRDGWYVDVNMNSGGIVWPVFNSLQAFWPGLQVLYGDFSKAAATHEAFYSVWRQYGFTPEGYNLMHARAQSGQEQYPLRPELLESTYLLYRATGDPVYLAVGRDMMASLRRTQTRCGHAMVSDVTTHTLSDSMESFFLSETLKYLFLLFDSGTGMNNLVDSGPFTYVFTTEGHVLPITPQLSNLADTPTDEDSFPGSDPRVAQNTRPLQSLVHPSLLLGQARFNGDAAQSRPDSGERNHQRMRSPSSSTTDRERAESSDAASTDKHDTSTSAFDTETSKLPARASLEASSEQRTTFIVGTRPAMKPYLEAQVQSHARKLLPFRSRGLQRNQRCSLHALPGTQKPKSAPLQKPLRKSSETSAAHDDDSDAFGRCSTRVASGRFARVRIGPAELEQQLHNILQQVAGVPGQEPLVLF